MDNLTFTLKTDYIELIKLLKVTGLASSGGMAQMLVTEGLVTVNSEPENRKRRKIRTGDIVKCDGNVIEII